MGSNEPTSIPRSAGGSPARRYSRWPILKYAGVDDLAIQPTAAGVVCYRVSGVCGLSGFVFAASMEFRSGPSRAEVGV